MTSIDLCSLILVLFAGLELGSLGFLDFSLAGWLFGSWKAGAYEIIGVAAIWQLCRQPIFQT
jgi:uncharacterized membrane protein YuzA (DUF378 family)